MPSNLPGFYYDEKLDRYFPLDRTIDARRTEPSATAAQTNIVLPRTCLRLASLSWEQEVLQRSFCTPSVLHCSPDSVNISHWKFEASNLEEGLSTELVSVVACDGSRCIEVFSIQKDAPFQRSSFDYSYGTILTFKLSTHGKFLGTSSWNRSHCFIQVFERDPNGIFRVGSGRILLDDFLNTLCINNSRSVLLGGSRIYQTNSETTTILSKTGLVDPPVLHLEAIDEDHKQFLSGKIVRSH